MGPDVDGIKLAGGSGLAMQRQAVVDLIDTAHEHGAYAACVGSLEFVLQKVLDADVSLHCRTLCRAVMKVIHKAGVSFSAC